LNAPRVPAENIKKETGNHIQTLVFRDDRSVT